MTVPDIKFQIVMGGVNEVISNLKSIQTSAERTYGAIQRSAAKHNSELIKFEQQKERKILDLHKKMVDGIGRQASASAKQQARIAKETVDAIERQYKRLGNIQSLPGNSIVRAGGTSGGGGGNTGFSGSSAFGGVRLTSGGNISMGGIGLSASGMGIGAMIAVGMKVIKTELDIIEEGLRIGADAVMQASKYFASSLFSAATQLGGGKDLAGVFVQRGNIDEIVAHLAAVKSAPGEEMTPSEIKGSLEETRKGMPFTEEDVAAMYNAFHEHSGKLKSFGRVSSDVLKIAKVNRMSAAESGDVFGAIMAQNPQLSAEQALQIMMNYSAGGQLGSVELKNALASGKATEFASEVGKGDIIRGSAIEFGMIQEAARKTGKGSMAITAARAFQQDLRTRTGGVGEENIISLYGQYLSNRGLLGKSRGTEVLEGYRSDIESRIGAGRSAEEQKKALREIIEEQGNNKQSLAELDEQYKKSSDNIKDKLIIAFNDLYEKINTNMGPSFDKFVAALIGAMKFIGDNAEPLGKAFMAFTGALLDLLPDIIVVLKVFGDTVLQVIGMIVAAIPDFMFPGGAAEKKRKLEDVAAVQATFDASADLGKGAAEEAKKSFAEYEAKKKADEEWAATDKHDWVTGFMTDAERAAQAGKQTDVTAPTTPSSSNRSLDFVNWTSELHSYHEKQLKISENQQRAIEKLVDKAFNRTGNDPNR